ncbi:MAG: hypothetical protein WCO45_11210 [Pseudanabaena sp. ELA607]
MSVSQTLLHWIGGRDPKTLNFLWEWRYQDGKGRFIVRIHSPI